MRPGLLSARLFLWYQFLMVLTGVIV